MPARPRVLRISGALPASVLAVLLAVLPAGCGPLPRPFEHEAVSALVRDPGMLAPVAIRPVEGAADLAPAMAAALLEEDVAATMAPPGGGYLVLSGRLQTATGTPAVLWSLADPDGRVLADLSQPLPSAHPAPGDLARAARASAASIARTLRSASGDVAPPPVPSIALRTVRTPPGFASDLLSKAMARALRMKGLAVSARDPGYVLDGVLSLTPSRDGQDLLAIDWTLFDAEGRSLGTISQASPVPHDQILSAQGSLARDIADAGADGVAEVIAKSAPARPGG
ncbi:MAG: hypothetical protein F8N37_02750 [Telmatospirillum sp.]|nr:hypothetical protein [Telmatospirillum sp.]